MSNNNLMFNSYLPSPWKVSSTSHHYYDYRIDRPNGQFETVTDELRYGTARLIAAAPELLEALEALDAYALNEIDGYAFSPLSDVVDAAIAKAKGEWS